DRRQQIRASQFHTDGILVRRPGERAALQAFVQDPEAPLIPREDLDAVAAPIPKQKQMAGKRVEREALSHQGGEPIDRTPQIGRSGGQVNPNGRRQGQHAARSVVSTVCTRAGDASAPMCSRSPVRNTTSITGELDDGATSTGTNPSARGAALPSSC